MKLNHLFLVLGTAAFASACTDGGNTNCDTATGKNCDTDETDTQDTDPANVDPSFNTAAWTNGWEDFVNCDEAGEVTLGAETNNWGGTVELYITQTTLYGEFVAWEENHTLDETSASSDNDGSGFSVFSRTLNTGATLESQAADVSTLWKCGDASPTLDPSAEDIEVSFALAVWAPNVTTGAPSDCIYFGQDPDEMVNDDYTGGTGDDGADRVLPSWLSAADCSKLP